jgi:pimeloyl-ACP methyl ester carboxylesterase
MKSFIIPLTGGAQLSGIHNLDGIKYPGTTTYRPLVVAIHGGSYSSTYFTASSGTTRSSLQIAEALDVPLIAIDRPGYRSSTAIGQVPAGSTFLREEGIHLHTKLLPALWQEFGLSAGAATIVLLSHSLGTPSAVIAAALHVRASEDSSKAHSLSYPLGGLIISGWGVDHARPISEQAALIQSWAKGDKISWPLDFKDQPMFGPDAARDLRVDPEILALKSELDHEMSVAEFQDAALNPEDCWAPYARDVVVPLLYGLAGEDKLWKASDEGVVKFVKVFESSSRIESSIVLEAPHCMELSHFGAGWMARCLGFAMECAVAAGVREKEKALAGS